MPLEEIESVSRRSSTQRQKNWDVWQEIFAALDNDIKAGKDLSDSPAAHLLMKLGGQLVSQMSREEAQDCAKRLHEHGIKKLKDAHSPSMGLIALYITQIAAGIVGAGLGCAPYALGVTGAAASSYQAMSQGVQSVFGQGSQNVAGIVQSGSQAEIAEINHENERAKQIHGDHANEQQQQQKNSQTSAEALNRLEQARHEKITAMLN